MAGLPTVKELVMLKSNSTTVVVKYEVFIEETVLVNVPSYIGKAPTTAVGEALITTGNPIPHLNAAVLPFITPRKGGGAYT